MSIDKEQITKGLKRRKQLRDKDLLEQARKENKEAALKLSEFMLGRLESDSNDTPLFYLNTLCTNQGLHYIFKRKPTIPDNANYSTITKVMASTGMGSYFAPSLCNRISYSFYKAFLEDTIVFSENEGYSMVDTSKSPIWYCTIHNISTEEPYKDKGIATIGIRDIIDFVFSTTSVDFIITSVSEHRPWSQLAFEKNGFKLARKIQRNDHINFYQFASGQFRNSLYISLDGGNKFLVPRCYPGTEGNFYLSRFDYEASKQK